MPRRGEMTAQKSKFTPKPRDWTDVQIAAYLNMSVSYFSAHREELYAQGMPRPDPLFGNKTDSKALRVWKDRRSGLVDRQRVSTDTPGRDVSLERVPHGASRA